MRFSPFEKVKDITELSNLCYSDMQVLSSLKESYSLEYKSEYNNSFKSEKLPKVISAFANCNGGWLIIGVTDNGIIQDIDLTGVREEEIYRIIGSRISPIPTVYITLLYKDNSKRSGVIVVYTEEGKNTPYISNGSVFVRNGNESKPADRSTLDLLLRKGMDHSDLSLKCVNCKDNTFSSYNKIGAFLPKDDVYYKFMSCFNGCDRVALYIENKGKHFDENIDLTIKAPILYGVDILRELLKTPNPDYEKYFMSFTELPSNPEITVYQRSAFHLTIAPPMQVPYSNFGMQESKEYAVQYMEYLVDCYNQYMEIFTDEKNIYYKISFKSINPGQKMFLPVALVFRNGITDIEYYFTSKYSMGIIEGKLIKSDND